MTKSPQLALQYFYIINQSFIYNMEVFFISDSALLNESYEISLRSIDIYDLLLSKNEFVLSRQFLRAATSIGANIREANYAESRKDFMHKLSIALKECNETLYWLELIRYHEHENLDCLDLLTKKCNSIRRMINASIVTCEKNMNKYK